MNRAELRVAADGQLLIESGSGGLDAAVSGVQCRYEGERVATKLRWGLTADDREPEVLRVYA
ncbi:hypothetical protein [Streptomyces rubiginosohelvolus]|uniref:hypothetical protein n=1 Tax=Streptomyces rubiginosohelvolus TaxID=67362 RepID=UPI00364A3652